MLSLSFRLEIFDVPSLVIFLSRLYFSAKRFVFISGIVVTASRARLLSFYFLPLSLAWREVVVCRVYEVTHDQVSGCVLCCFLTFGNLLSP